MRPWRVTDASDYVVWPASIQAMVTMGLGSWPLSAIAVPEALATHFYPTLACHRDISAERVRVFPPELIAMLDTVGQQMHQLNTSAYVVGGLVRDALISLDSKQACKIDSPDVDITVEGEAIGCAYALVEQLPQISLDQVFDAYGTAKLHYNQYPMDLASTRIESYQAMGVMPTVGAMGVPLADDVMRRDFTVNTLAMAVHNPGQVLDSTGGLADLASKMLRILTPHSCYEDPSRIMRAFKYAMRLNFQWSGDTAYVIAQSLTHIAKQSSQAKPPFEGGGERVRIEWHECLALPESLVKTQWLSRFFELGAWRVMLPTLPASAQPSVDLTTFAAALEQTTYQRAQSDVTTADLYWLLCLLSMPEPQRELAITRLGCRKPLVDAVTYCKTFRDARPNPFDQGLSINDPVGIVALCSTLSPLALWFLALSSQDVSASAAIIATYMDTLAQIKPALTGRDLQSMGVLPGPRMGELLKGLLHAKLLGNLVTVSDEHDWVQRQLTDSPDS